MRSTRFRFVLFHLPGPSSFSKRSSYGFAKARVSPHIPDPHSERFPAFIETNLSDGSSFVEPDAGRVVSLSF